MNINDVIKDYKKYNPCDFEKEFYLNSNDSILPILVFYSYLNKEYLKCICYSEKCKHQSTSIIYYILSLFKLGYKDESYRMFINYKESINDFVYNPIIKNHILQCFLLFKDDGLKSIIRSFNESVYKEIYIFFISIVNNVNLEENIRSLENMLYESEKLEIRYIISSILGKFKDDKYSLIAQKLIDKKPEEYEKEDFKLNKECRIYSSFDYQDDNYTILSYKSQYMMNMHLIEYKNNVLIIDCGASIDREWYINKINVKEFFEKNNISINCIQGILITHAHFDHYGSLNELTKYNIKCYMTLETEQLIRKTNKDFVLNNVTIIDDNENFTLGRFKIKAFKNGHILGSVGYIIDGNEKRIMITGDFCLNNQSSVLGMNLKDKGKIDYLIIETTYGDKKFSLSYLDRMKSIKEIVKSSLKYGIQVLMPSFAIGRAQEIAKILEDLSKEYKILIDGNATEITKYYLKNSFLKINKNIEINSCYGIRDNLNIYDIIICSSGMLNKGSKSEQYLNYIQNDNIHSNYTVIKVGYIPEYNQEYKDLKFYDSININLFDIGLSAHGTYNQLIKTIDFLNPSVVIQVHGNGIK